MMKYREFFRIEIDHQYFSSDRISELCLVPDKASLKFLNGQHFILKGTSNGVSVLIPIDESGAAKPIFREDDSLTFEVFPESGAFSLFTDVPEPGTGQVLHFTNEQSGGGGSVLPSSIVSGTGSLNGFQLIAKIEIQLTNTLLNSAEAAIYKVEFKVKSETWKYYLIADPETTNLNIVDREGNLIFNQVSLENNSTDKVGIALKSNFPDANIVLFESASPIPCSNQVLKNLQLFREASVIIKHLPNPEINDSAIKIIKINNS